MSQHVRSIEDIPDEAADLAVVAAQLIAADPDSRRAFAELAAIFAAGLAAGVTTAGEAIEPGTAIAFSSLPSSVATAARIIAERSERRRRSMTLPRKERELWEDAGAVFDARAIELDAVNAGAALSDLINRSLIGDQAVAALLKVDRSRISQRIRDKSLYAYSRDDTRYFPTWQFTDGSTLPGLRKVLFALDDGLHPLVVDHWFTTPSVDLEVGHMPVAPATWLQTGGNPTVVAMLASDL